MNDKRKRKVRDALMDGSKVARYQSRQKIRLQAREFVAEQVLEQSRTTNQNRLCVVISNNVKSKADWSVKTKTQLSGYSRHSSKLGDCLEQRVLLNGVLMMGRVSNIHSVHGIKTGLFQIPTDKARSISVSHRDGNLWSNK